MSRTTFCCRRCSFTSNYTDSLRRHYVTKHRVGVKVGRSGHLEEVDLTDPEDEVTRVRRRQAKGPYPKEPSRRRSPDSPHPTVNQPTTAPLTPVPLLSLQVSTPPDHAPSGTVQKSAKSSSASFTCPTTTSDAANPSIGAPIVAQFNPVSHPPESSPALTPPPGGAALLDISADLADMAPPSPDPFWSCVAGPASVETGCEAPVSTPPVTARCCGVKKFKSDFHSTSTLAAGAATSSFAPAAGTSPTPSSAIGTTIGRDVNTRISVPIRSTSASATVDPERTTTSSPSGEFPGGILSSAAIWTLLMNWTPSAEESLARIGNGALLQDAGLRRRVCNDISLVRRTARCIAGHILGGHFDCDDDSGRATSGTLRQWLLRFVE